MPKIPLERCDTCGHKPAPMRLLPHDLSLEASILGGVILRNEALAFVPTLEVDHFYDLRHKVVFSAMRVLEAASRPIDIATLGNEIRAAGKIDSIGGEAFLCELALRVPTAENVEAYAELVIELAVSRQALLKMSEFSEQGFDESARGADLINNITAGLMSIQTGSDRPILTLGELIATEAQGALDDVERRNHGEHVYAGIPTGIRLIDDRIGGHPRGLMTMYIGRPAMGKSTIALQCAFASMSIADEQTLIASFEDSGQSFGQRGLAQETGVNTENIRSRRLDPTHVRAIGERWQHVQRPELLLSAAGMTVEELVRRVKRENVKRRMLGLKPLAQLIVDYIQKIPRPKWAKSSDEAVSYISNQLTTLAANENMAVVAMCQLNREAERREDHRPRLADIRDSGSLEQDGKLIFGLYHPYAYLPEKHVESEYHLLVLKNHQGMSHGDIPLWWDRPTHTIYDSELDYQRVRASRGA